MKLENGQADIFEKYFKDVDGNFYFEGMWLRNQRPENAKASGFIDESTARRRYVHFYDNYDVIKEGADKFLAVVESYIIVTNTLPKIEIDEYVARIMYALGNSNFTHSENGIYENGNLCVEIRHYTNHPKNKEVGVVFPDNYESVDVIVYSKGFNYLPHYNRMWEHSTKMFRNIDKRENPTYETNLAELKKYLPAQIEFGCGPSIEAGIPPLYSMHETYKVQNHDTGKFYFAETDNLIESIILQPEKMYYEFSKMLRLCLQAEHTPAYLNFLKAYEKGLFTGIVYNNNFDRLISRFCIPEKILRIYEKSKYITKIAFEPNVKSLICFGTHADRRQVQKQAREIGLKVIYVDCEGFFRADGSFESYALESPKNNDIIFKMTFSQFMSEFSDLFLG